MIDTAKNIKWTSDLSQKIPVSPVHAGIAEQLAARIEKSTLIVVAQ